MLKKLMGPKLTLRLLVLLAMLVALGIVIGRFLSFGTNVFQISLTFIVNSVLGAVGGPIWTGIALAASDVLGTVLFGKFGYFPGFTFSAFVVGLIYGCFFFRKRLSIGKWQDWLYVLVAMSVVMLVDTAFFNTLWITLRNRLPFSINLATRLPLLWQIPLRTGVVMLVLPALQRIPLIEKIMDLK